MLATVTAGAADRRHRCGRSIFVEHVGGDDGRDAQGRRRRVPRRQPDEHPREPAPEAHDGRDDEGLHADRLQRQVGGVERAVRGRDGVQRPDPGSADRRVVRRPHPDRGGEPARSTDRRPLPRHDGSQRDGRRPVHHAGPDHAGPGVDVRVHRQGSAGHVRLPLALQLDRTGGRGTVRGLDRRAAGRALAVPRVDGRRPDRRHDGRRSREGRRRVDVVPRRRTARLRPQRRSRSRRRHRSSPRRATGC